jgi:hypothetical protein
MSVKKPAKAAEARKGDTLPKSGKGSKGPRRPVKPNSKGFCGQTIPDSQWEKFFAAVCDCASIGKACEVSGIARVTVYRLRHKDEEFKQKVDEARAIGYEYLLEQCEHRAFLGYTTKKVVKGKNRDYTEITENYSDTLAMFLLKGEYPQKFRERASVENVNVNVDATSDVTIMESIRAKLLR